MSAVLLFAHAFMNGALVPICFFSGEISKA